MKTFTKWSILAIGFLTILLIIITVSPVQAQDERESGAIWTTRNDCGEETQNVNHFQHVDWIYINGAGFSTDEERPWYIMGQPGQASTDPGVNVAEGFVTPVSGAFCFAAYQVANDDAGEYKYGVAQKHDNYQVEPGEASFNYSIGAYIWSVGGGSQRAVTLTITGASVIFVRSGDGTYGPYTSSQTINLPAGNYSYTWEATLGNEGSGAGSFTIDPCPAGSASASPGTCEWDGEVSTTDVEIFTENASLTLTGPGGIIGTYIAYTVVPDLAPGYYTYTWTALPGHSGAGSGSFTLIDCEPSKADAAVDVGVCFWDEQESKSYFLATLTLHNAALTIGGQTYTESSDIKLVAGSYHYTWVATGDAVGSGDGDISVEGCEPASVNVVVGACDWIDETSITPVTLTINGATLTLFAVDGGSVEIDVYGPGVHVINLPTGVYSYTWVADEDFVGSGSGRFETLYCEPGKSDAGISIGACTYSDGKSLTLVSISINNAIFTIDGQTFSENAELKLSPGNYPYAWEAKDEDFQGEGSGILTVGSCDPKEEDEDPDIPAGGNGPSLTISLTPALLTMSGVAIAWLLIKHRIKKI